MTRSRYMENADTAHRRRTYQMEKLAAAGWIPVTWIEALQDYVKAEPEECFRVRCPLCSLHYDHSSATAREKHLIQRHGYEMITAWKMANAFGGIPTEETNE